MALNFNTQPYYDDFSEDKNFHKILFKPGFSVQARELTQIQSILQDQISKFGKFVLSDGSKVTGGRYFIDTNAKSLKLNNIGTLTSDIEYFTGLFVVGATSKCISKITFTDVINYNLTVKPIVNGTSNYVSGETLQFFTSKQSALDYLSNPIISSDYTATLSIDTITSISNVTGIQNSKIFTISNASTVEIGDVISIPSAMNPYDIYVVVEVLGNGQFTVNKSLDENYNLVPILITKYASRDVMEVGFDSGVYFTNGYFVKALSQTIIPNSKTQYPSVVVGYEVNESIIDYVTDSSLLDPAQYSYNYTAPGANRYKIYLNLVSKPFIDGSIQNLTTNKFIELLRIKNGIIIKDNTNPVLGALEDTLARQMYDHAGNFVVKDFSISFKDTDFADNHSTLNAEISPGKAYVFGHEYQQSFPTFIEIDKGRDTNSITNYDASISYGNYIAVTPPVGSVLTPQAGIKVELHSTTYDKVNLTSFVAYAYVKNITYVSDSQYNLYLFNISATDISSVQSVVLPTNSTYATLNFKTNTIQTNGKLTLVDPTDSNFLFKLPQNFVSEVSNLEIVKDYFDSFTTSANTVTINTSSAHSLFTCGSSTGSGLSLTVKKEYFIVCAKTTNGPYTAGQYIDLSQIQIVVSSSVQIATLTFLNGYTGSVDVKYTLSRSGDVTEKTKTLVQNYVSTVTPALTPTSLKIADISNFKGVFYSPIPTSTYIGEWATGYNGGLGYAKGDVVLSGGILYFSFIALNTVKPSIEHSQWGLLTNVTDRYILNNGQTEFLYDHGFITSKSTLDRKQVFVLFDYYTHSTGGEYFYYKSYTNTQYSKIPTTLINNVSYDLKNYIDFRPRRSNNASGYSFDTYNMPSTVFLPIIFDYSYYMGRIDKLVLTSNKVFQWLRGIPSITNFVPPSDLANAMTLATIKIKPFTSSADDVTITYKKHRRYTMDDIGNLDKRLTNVEYYTSLNLVEKDVMSRNITDNVVGNRMKNGFVVDAFVGYGVMAMAENYKNCSIDLKEQSLRPSFDSNYLDIAVQNIGTLNVQDGIVSFPYTEAEVSHQILATSITNCNPFDVISYAGHLELSPQSDVWVDHETKPIINIVNDDTKALSEAISTPGNVYDEWNSLYSTSPYKVDDTIGSTVNEGGYGGFQQYSVGSAQILKSDIIEISTNIIPYARSINIRFKASQLAPLTQMYMYINGRLVNGYIKPLKNPLGLITSAQITNTGKGYYAANTALNVIASNTSISNISLGFIGTTISDLELISKGSGYPTSNNIITAIVGSGSNAAISISTIPPIAGDLYTDNNGECSGILTLPNDDVLKFASGELHIIICDDPNYNPQSSLSKAEAIFYSSGKKEITQETTTSIREPYIKKLGWIPPIPTSGGKIIVQSQVSYSVRNDNLTNKDDVIDYPLIKQGTITLPVYLSQKPNSDVTITWLDTKDNTSNTTYSFNKTSLVFGANNYNISQNITLTYNLGDRPDNFADNHLFNYLEYYATSSDVGYNYTGSKLGSAWTQSILSTGLAYTKFIPTVIKSANTLPASIVCSSIPNAQGIGETLMLVSPNGQKYVKYLPITFTVSSNASSTCEVTGIYPLGNTSNFKSGNQITFNTLTDFNNFIVQLKYYDVGDKWAKLTVTSSGSPDPTNYWNGITGNTNFHHLVTPVPVPSPAIIVLPSEENPRYTTEDGKSHLIGVKLSSSPSVNVVLIANSTLITEGVVTGCSNDSITVISGNTVLFTPTDWSNTKSIIVTGKADSLPIGTDPGKYFVNMKTLSANSSWNNLFANVEILNKESTAVPPVVPGYILYTYSSGNIKTTETGNTANVLITLSKAPTTNVIVNAISTSAIDGKIVTNSALTFTTSNWSVAQTITVKGQNNPSSSNVSNYAINLLAISSDKQFDAVSNTAPLQNYDDTKPAVTPGILVCKLEGDDDKTCQDGKTITLGVKLASQPAFTVTVNSVTDNPTRGKVTKGGSLVFDSSNWNTNQYVIVSGQSNTEKVTGLYNLLLTAASADVAYDKLTASVPLQNLTRNYPATGQILTAVNGLPQTTHTGGKAIIAVTLSRSPVSNVIVSATSSNTSEGLILTGNTLVFTTSNWNQPQISTVTGQVGVSGEGDINYNVIFTANTGTNNVDPNGYVNSTVALVNKGSVAQTYVRKTISTSTSYQVLCAAQPGTWSPSVDVTACQIKDWVNTPTTPSNFTVKVLQTNNDGSIILQSSCKIVKASSTSPKGIVGVQYEIKPGFGTTFISPNVTTNDFDEYKYKAWYWGNEAKSNHFYNITNLSNNNKWHNKIYEAEGYENDKSNWDSGTATSKCNHRLTGFKPDFPAYDITVREIMSTTLKVEIIDAVTQNVLSESTSTSIGYNNIWNWISGYDQCIGASGWGVLNQKAYNALLDFCNSFGSVDTNYLNTIRKWTFVLHIDPSPTVTYDLTVLNSSYTKESLQQVIIALTKKVMGLSMLTNKQNNGLTVYTNEYYRQSRTLAALKETLANW